MKTEALIALIVGTSGLFFGLYQYYVGQKWRKSEFAAKQLEKLAEDPILSVCCTFLDWSARRMMVPEQYKIYTDKEFFIHEWKTLSKAMVPESEVSGFNWEEVIYRDYFDHFFTYLEMVNHFISIKLISTKDVSSLDYWLKQIASPRFTDSPIFINFLKYYEFHGVLGLMRRFNIQYDKE